MLNSIEHDGILTARESKIAKKRKTFLAFKLFNVVFITLINVKIPTLVDILTFISMMNFMLIWVEHKNVLLPRGLACILPYVEMNKK